MVSRVAGSREQGAGGRLQVAGGRLQACFEKRSLFGGAGGRLQVAGGRLQVCSEKRSLFGAAAGRLQVAVSWVVGQCGFYERTYREARGERMLIYHGICEKDHTRFNPIFLTAKMFEEHLRYFKKYFQVVSLAEYMEGPAADNAFRVCLSFDDGFANNHRFVLPLLKKYNVPAVFFITAARACGEEILWNDFLNMFTKYGPAKIEWNSVEYKRNRFRRYVNEQGIALADELRKEPLVVKHAMIEKFSRQFDYRKNENDRVYWQLLSETEIREMSDCPLVTIAAHSLCHNDLRYLKADEAEADFRESGKWLESITGKPVQAYAFPYGAYSTSLADQAVRTGYKYLLAADELLPGDVENKIRRKRMTVNPFINIHQQMHAIIRGTY